MPIFVYDAGHENRLVLDVEQKMYLIMRGRRAGVLCSGWYVSISVVHFSYRFIII